jgi:uncharacterized cupin superfamily protein
MVPEAPLETTNDAVHPVGPGWFVVNAREALWVDRGPRGLVCPFEGREDAEFPQVGFNLFVLGPAETMSMYHWEADQEDFLVLAGQPVLLVEGEERQLEPLDFVHCPAGTDHTIIGGREGRSVVIAVGARVDSLGENWGGYPVHEIAVRHDASAERETTDPKEAYARFPERRFTSYGEGWLP